MFVIDLPPTYYEDFRAALTEAAAEVAPVPPAEGATADEVANHAIASRLVDVLSDLVHSGQLGAVTRRVDGNSVPIENVGGAMTITGPAQRVDTDPGTHVAATIHSDGTTLTVSLVSTCDEPAVATPEPAPEPPATDPVA